MVADNKGIQTVIGGTAGGLFKEDETTPQNAPALFDLLIKHGIKSIDTAIIYGDSEKVLGKYNAGQRGFSIDTKIPGGMKKESMYEEKLVELGHESLQKLNIKQIDVFYLHSPAADVPISTTLAGVNTLYKEGAFRRFGLSNFKPEQVEEVYNYSKEQGYVLPSVYQGSYNAFGRHYELTNGLFPLLRKLKISFYAYSPAAGGFLSKTPENLFEAGGRYDKDSKSPIAGMYNALYSDRPSIMTAHAKWNAIANEASIKPGAMALRWVKYNSALKPEHGDAIIVGSRTLEQTDETLTLLEEGPLPEDVAKKIDALWDIVKDEAITDNFHDFMTTAKTTL